MAASARWSRGVAAARTRAATVLSHPLFVWALLGTFVRLLLAPFTSWTADVVPYYFAARDLATYGSPYYSMNFSYPPLLAYLQFPLELAVLLTASPAAKFVPSLVPLAQFTSLVTPIITSPAFNLAAKAPMLAADLLLGWLLYSLLRRASETAARRAFLLWYLNPLVILVDAAQGQFDVLPSVLVLVAMVSLLERRRWVAGVALAAAIALKVYALFLVPLFAAALLAQLFPEAPTVWAALRSVLVRRGLRPTVTFLGSLALASALFFLPSSAGGVTALTRRATLLQPGGFGGVSFFFWVTGSVLLPRANYGGNALYVSVALVAAMAVVALYVAVRAFPHLRWASPHDGLVILSLGTIFVLLGVFLFSPLVNPQYLLWVLPALIIVSTRWRTFETWLLVLSLAGIAFEVGLMGPAAYLFPLAVYTGVVPVETVAAAVASYYSAPGLLYPRLWLDVTTVGTCLGFLALAVIGYRAVRIARPRRRGVAT